MRIGSSIEQVLRLICGHNIVEGDDPFRKRRKLHLERSDVRSTNDSLEYVHHMTKRPRTDTFAYRRT